MAGVICFVYCKLIVFKAEVRNMATGDLSPFHVDACVHMAGDAPQLCLLAG